MPKREQREDNLLQVCPSNGAVITCEELRHPGHGSPHPRGGITHIDAVEVKPTRRLRERTDGSGSLARIAARHYGLRSRRRRNRQAMQDQIFRTQFFVTTFVNRFPPGENTTTADSRPPAWTSSTRASSSAWFAHARSIELAQTIATAVQCR